MFYRRKGYVGALRDRSKIRGGGGRAGANMVKGPWFFMQAQKGGSNNLVHVIKGGGHYFLCKDAGVKESIYNSSLVTVILL